MIISTISNVAVIILCMGVLIQTTRMILALQTFRKSDIGQTVAALDNATTRASSVLAELRHMLASEAAANNRSVAAAEALRDELSVMIGVGNSVAERIMEAAATATPAKPKPAESAPTTATASARPPARRKSTRRSTGAPETPPASGGVH